MRQMSSKTSCKHSCDKCLSPGISNISLDESDLSIPTNDITGNSYENTPSPSSIASTSTIHRSSKSRGKSDYHSHMSFKRRCRPDKLLHHTNSINRQYILTMTNILFQMQREIYKLKRRSKHVERMLANQIHSGRPIIRIPRLTKDEITTICVNDKETQQNVAPMVSTENATNHMLSTTIVDNNDTLNKPEEHTESTILIQTTNQLSHPPATLTKYCIGCDHEFSHRSAYLRHIRRIHHGVYPKKPNEINPVEEAVDNSHHETIVSTTDQPEIDLESDSFQVLVNEWDYGEGRLRPRRGSKQSGEPLNKIKCDICNKFFRADYIKKHKRRTHPIKKSSSPNESILKSDQTVSTTVKSVDSVQTIIDQSPTIDTNPPSAITIADMDVDDMPIQFRKESNKPLVIASTCLEGDQIKIFTEFLQKFSPRVCQSASVNARTTHLITNDDRHPLRSPLSMKLIEGIANHCFCISYRWLIDCYKYDRIIDETPYEIESDNTDNHIHGGPRRSRSVEKRNALFENIRFMIKCTDNNDIRMTNDRLQDLIITCGGQIINCVTQNLLDEYTIVVLCDRLYVSERRHNYDQCRELGIHFVSSDWVLESILEYQIKPFTSYEETPTSL